MELKTMTKDNYDKAIDAIVTLKQVREYLDYCELNEIKPDTEWLKYLLKE